MDKYEILACSTFLTEFDPNLPSIEEAVKHPKTIIWQPFEDYTYDFIISAISNLANSMKKL